MGPNGPGFPPAELRIATDGDMRDLGRRLAALLRAGDLVILAGPLVYFAALHMVFASSMRYRIPGEMPALGLAAIGCMSGRRGPVRAG